VVSGIFARLRTPLWRPLRRFWKDGHGVSAVEFALIVPILLSLYFGAVEIGQALIINRKVTHATSTIADLVSQANSVSQTDMDNIMLAVEAVMLPYNSVHMRARVSFVTIDSSGVAKVTWNSISNFDAPTSCASPCKEPKLTQLAANTVVTLPTAVRQNSTYLVSAEVHYYFTPQVGYLLTGTIDLKDNLYLRPRLNATITGP
jgi:Flp pilus assembly protein TadG